jgi:hypothetical protein
MPAAEAVNKKVILLFIVNEVADLTPHQLMTLSLDTLYMDYFSFSKLCEELVHDGLLHLAERKGEQEADASGRKVRRFAITESGKRVLATLEQTIPLPVQRNLRQRIAKLHQAVRREQEVTASYAPSPVFGWQVRLTLQESNAELLSLDLQLPQEEQAEQVCQNWKQRPAELYASLLQLLLEQTDE